MADPGTAPEGSSFAKVGTDAPRGGSAVCAPGTAGSQGSALGVDHKLGAGVILQWAS